MKHLLILSVVLLSGCSSFNTLLDSYLMKYDTNEYRIVAEIRTDAEKYKTECDNPLTSTLNSVAMADKTRLFVLYSQYQPHNKQVINSSIELNKIAQGLKDQYVKSGKVSPMFCKLKYETLEHSAETIQKTVGAKPR